MNDNFYRSEYNEYYRIVASAVILKHNKSNFQQFWSDKMIYPILSSLTLKANFIPYPSHLDDILCVAFSLGSYNIPYSRGSIR